MPGRMISGPKNINAKGIMSRKNKVSKTTEYNMIETVFAVGYRSCDKRMMAVADPPRDVGETAEANSQIKISSMHFHQLK